MAVGAKGMANCGKEQAQVISNLGRRPNRGAGSANGVFLFNGNGRPDVNQLIYIGTVQAFHEHSRVRGQGFHVAPLALGVKRVEGQRGFPRPGHARDNRDGIVRYADGDVTKVILPGTLND